MEFCISTCAPLLSSFVTGHHWEKSGSIFHTSPTSGIYTHLEDPPEFSLLQVGQSLAPTSPHLMDAPRPELFWWSFAGLSPCLSHTGESRTRLLQMCLPGAEQRRRITPLDVMAVLCPTAATFSTRDTPLAHVQLACWQLLG